MTDQELKALGARIEELRVAAEQIVAESKAIIEQVKRSVNRNKQTEEDDWASEGGGQKQGD
jgi:hypothetical protein